MRPGENQSTPPAPLTRLVAVGDSAVRGFRTTLSHPDYLHSALDVPHRTT
jgi:hypothetical protein